jgi:putative ABC transport system ATP-binding protein
VKTVTSIQFTEARREYVQGRRRVTALDGVSLSIEPGEFVAVTGPSGSGKSTLLHLAAVLDVPTSGSVTIEGRETAALSEEERTLLRRTRIGLVFQFFNLIPTLTVLENTSLPGVLSGGRLGDSRPAAERLLERVGLRERLTHLPEELSGGEMQRVAIARALINDPALLLADEPTGNLDSANGREILDLLAAERGTRTVVVVTHDPAVVAVADRAIRLRDGRLDTSQG